MLFLIDLHMLLNLSLYYETWENKHFNDIILCHTNW